MKKSDELKQTRSAKQDEMQGIVDKAATEKREFTEAEDALFDSLKGEVDGLDKQIERQLQVEKLALERAARSANPVMGDKGDGEGGELGEMKKRYSLHKALRSQLPGQKLDGVEKELHEETVKRAKEAGIAIEGVAVPLGLGNEKRFAGQSVTQDSGAYGASLVNTENREIIDFLRPKPIVEELGARYMTGLQGNLKWPVNNGGITAYWEGEVDETPLSKNAYGSKDMSPKRLGAAVPISLQNLMQSSIDLEKYTIDEINAVMANAMDIAAINGSGTGYVPQGIMNATGINTIAIGANGGPLTWAQIVAMETAVFVENANAAKMGYAINPATKGRLKVTKHESGDLGYLMTGENTINGYNVGVSNLIPGNLSKGTGTNLSAAIFGDFSQLMIGQWGWLDLTVDNISKKKSGYIEIVVNMFVDIMVRQPKAFSVIKDISNV